MQIGEAALGAFVRALAQKSYEEFDLVKDQMHGDIPQANRDKLLTFLPKARHKLTRFLVLIRYLKTFHNRTKALEVRYCALHCNTLSDSFRD